MSTFVVSPVAPEITTQVRTTRRSPQYGHPVHEEIAQGTGPCRACLRAFTVGEDARLLFTYSPFGGDALPQPGPVFIHADACQPHDGPGYPAGLRDLPIAAQLYYDDGTIANPRPLPVGDESSWLESALEDSRVEFVNLRHAEAGCFVARVERIAAGDAARV